MATCSLPLITKSYIVFINIISILSIDPCLEGNYKILSDLPKRSPDFAQDAAPICDRYLEKGWYKAPNYEMVTSPPSIGFCGTLYPFWLKGALPETAGTSKVLEACEVGFATDCQQIIYVNVTNCGSFNVYYLMPLFLCNSAYCFGIEEVPKNPRVIYHNVEYTETENDFGIQYSPLVNLRCDFTPLDDETLLYHIDWDVNKKTVISGQTVTSSSLNNATLSTQLLSDEKIKIGASVQCIVGAKKTEKEKPCTSSSSSLFFAGFQVLTPTLTLQRKGSATVKIRPTIPFATETFYSKRAKNYFAASLDVTVSFPDQIGAKCASGSSNRCKITIEGITYDQRQKFADNSWYKTYEMKVHNTDNIAFNNNVRQIILRMKTSGGGANAADIFNEVTLPDININVVESMTVWKGKRCHSHADPHMKTFDGYAYECQHTGCVTGITSILFENKEQNQQVQVRHHKCFNPNARCICAIAVRSGRDVFMFDACNGRQYINFPICDDKSLKVVRVTDKSYKIFFPTGTYVDATLNMARDWFIQTQVYPSVADVGKSGGLCGLLDGNTRNDLTRRSGTVDNPNNYNYRNPPDAFSISWRATFSEDLFAPSMDFSSLKSLSLTNVKFCACNQGVTECSYQQFTDCSGMTRGKEYECILHSSTSRRKRHAVYILSFSPDPIELTFSNRVKRQAYDITDNATTICSAAFEASFAYRTCRDNVADFSSDSVKDCILDVSLTGDPSLVTFHLESAIDQCKAFINLNETLQETEPEVAKEITSICQNNCSLQGTCRDGSCFCDDGFGGSDCSFNMTEPPNITEVLVGELCDKSTEICSSITFFGQYFVENTNATCYIQTNDFSLAGKIQSRKTFEEPLDVQTLYEANCPNPNVNTTSWIHQFVFNVSNDGQKFTRTLSVFVYDSECQIPRNNSWMGTFGLTDGYCFIDGQCIVDGQAKKENESLICDANRNVFQWSLVEGSTETAVSKADYSTSGSMTVETSTRYTSVTTQMLTTKEMTTKSVTTESNPKTTMASSSATTSKEKITNTKTTAALTTSKQTLSTTSKLTSRIPTNTAPPITSVVFQTTKQSTRKQHTTKIMTPTKMSDVIQTTESINTTGTVIDVPVQLEISQAAIVLIVLAFIFLIVIGVFVGAMAKRKWNAGSFGVRGDGHEMRYRSFD
ncbi:von Willebrand factor D and EGF domain-containing protein-like isoform X2 [Saccostrea cucullata]|uniref:von Willebrand factor D and EGF domain-containing protein-like isoform X2 n=1 Tax=Saccostrea cuccullata TaxID=36930 RepID=UPI002ECFCBCE